MSINQVPKDVWKLILAKVEPPSPMDWISIKTNGDRWLAIPFSKICRMSNEFYANRYYIWIGCKCKHDYKIYQDEQLKLYDRLLKFIKSRGI